MKPAAGAVLLDGADLHRMPTKEVARRIGLLPQSPIAPEAPTVVDLVARGRHPHQRWFAQSSWAHEAAVAAALSAAGCDDLADPPVDELSGGQRQRVWIAMTLVQETPILLLDEPTTYLDLAHQIDVLDLLADLNAAQRRTMVMVVHDLNQACRYGDHLVAVRDGQIVVEGPPAQIVTKAMVEAVFGIATQILDDPVTGTPLVVPVGGRRRVHDVVS